MYTTSQLAARFQITDQSVKRYSKEFKRFLSPTANPEKGDTRLFTDADLKTYDLVVRMSKVEHKSFEQITLALDQGQHLDNVVLIETTELAGQSTAIQQQVMAKIEILEGELKRLQYIEARYQEVKEQLAEAQSKLLEAYKQIGKLGG